VQYVSNKEKFNAKITIVTDENGKVKLQFYTNYSSTTQNSSAIFSEIQLEEGEKATTYEAYIEPKLLLRNSNGVYEEFVKKSEEVYSTDEQAIGKWTNGKTIYRKVINIATLPNASSKNVPHNIEDLSQICNISGRASNGENFLPLPFVTNVLNNNILLSANKTDVVITTYIDRTNYNLSTVVLEYTKTTD
jgi:hypothetical protein